MVGKYSDRVGVAAQEPGRVTMKRIGPMAWLDLLQASKVRVELAALPGVENDGEDLGRRRKRRGIGAVK